MNYIQQIRAFDDFKLYKARLSAGQIALWHVLMSINNKTSWQEWFTAANVTLESLSGLSRSGILKNRNILKQMELIDFKTNGRKSTSYHVCTLYTSDSKHESNQSSKHSSKHSSTHSSKHSSKHESNTLVKHKQNETKQNTHNSARVDYSPLSNDLKVREKFTMDIWPLFEKKIKFEGAFKAYCEDLLEGATNDQIIAALKKQAEFYRINGTQQRYMVNSQTYFEERRYTDDVDLTPPAKTVNGHQIIQKETIPDWKQPTTTQVDPKAEQNLNERLAAIREQHSGGD